MPNPALSKAEALRRIEAIHQALRDGHKPLGMAGKGEGSISAAAKSLGMPRQTLDSSLKLIMRDYGLAPDWSLYVRPSPLEPPQKEKPRIRVRMPSRDDGPRQRVLGIGDAHDDPRIDKERFKWFGRHAAETEPTHIVQIGDLLTLDSLNGHIPNETFAGRLKGTFIDDIASGNEALEIFGREYDGPADKRVKGGNHEHRLFRFEDSSPEVAGMMQVELHSILDRNGWSWTPFGEIDYIGGVGFVHIPLNTLGRPYGGKIAANAIANDAVTDLVWGHDHRPMVRTVPKLGTGNFIRLVNLGCALPHGWVEEYAKHSLSGWGWGVWDLVIYGGHIQSANFISMIELEERYS